MPGRTGRRRYTLAEAALVGGPKAVADHKRRYGRPAADTAPKVALGPPPDWFSPELAAIWKDVVAAAPPGLLGALDHPGVLPYVVAIEQHHRLARVAAAGNLPLAPKEATELRAAARALHEAGRYLGISIGERQKLALAEPARTEAPSDDNNTWAELRRFPTIEGGKLVKRR
jgi:hypothetical protein